jgi:hypothetical protein
MPPIARELYDDPLKVRRAISDTFVRDGLGRDISLVRRFVIVFGCQFPVSRGIFANSFSDLLFGSLERGDWIFSEDDPSATAVVKRDFPRSIEYDG